MQIRRYASHYLLLPEYGFLKQQVVEIRDGYVLHIFPLTEELEFTEWMPGVIVLLKEEDPCPKEEIYRLFQSPYRLLREMPADIQTSVAGERPAYLLYPFDFKRMMPGDDTEIRRLK